MKRTSVVNTGSSTDLGLKRWHNANTKTTRHIFSYSHRHSVLLTPSKASRPFANSLMMDKDIEMLELMDGKRLLIFNEDQPEKLMTTTRAELILAKFLRMKPHKERKLRERRSRIEIDREEKKNKDFKNDLLGRAIDLWKEGIKIKDLSIIFDINMRTLTHHIKLYKDSKKWYFEAIGRPSKYKQAQIDYVHKLLMKQKFSPVSLYRIKCLVNNHFKDEPQINSLMTVRKIIEKCGFSRKRAAKRIAQRNSENTLSKRFETSCIFLHLLEAGKHFIFIDESNFSNQSIPIYGYSCKGKPYTVVTPQKRLKYSVILAITHDQLLGFQIHEGSIKAKDFACFLLAILREYRMIRENLQDYVFFVDNASIHRARKIRDFLKSINLMYNAPYSPFMNPIEEAFALWKADFRKRLCGRNENFLDCIIKSSAVLDDDHCFAYFCHSLKFFVSGLERLRVE